MSQNDQPEGCARPSAGLGEGGAVFSRRPPTGWPVVFLSSFVRPCRSTRGERRVGCMLAR